MENVKKREAAVKTIFENNKQKFNNSGVKAILKVQYFESSFFGHRKHQDPLTRFTVIVKKNDPNTLLSSLVAGTW